MEQDGAMETIYYVETPYAANEEEIATSYITVENEEGIETAEVIEHAEIIENDGDGETIEDAEPEKREDYDSNIEDHIGSDENSVPEEILLVRKPDNEKEEEMQLIASEVTASGSASDLSCRICSKTFTKSSNKLRHYRRVHNIKRQNGTSIRCIECDSTFSQISRLRSHLSEEHKLDMSEEYLRFPSLEGK